MTKISHWKCFEYGMVQMDHAMRLLNTALLVVAVSPSIKYHIHYRIEHTRYFILIAVVVHALAAWAVGQVNARRRK